MKTIAPPPSLSRSLFPCADRAGSNCLAGILFLALCLCSTVQPAWGRDDRVDYSEAEVPLYEQIVNRIKDGVGERLGEGRNARDRYFIIPFAYENKGNEPEFSHSFMTVIRVFGDDRQPKATAGLKARKFKNHEFEAFTVSWLPHDFMENPDLCVFEGFGARLIASRNRCPLSVGKSFTLPETAKLAVHARVAVGMWGPYEITREGFQLCVDRLKLLEKGSIKYRADDRLTRKKLAAINCFHAMAGIYELFPNGGLFGTGLNMWGINGTERVLIEYTTKASVKGQLLEPVDVKADLYGFVYAPEGQGRVYNPFKRASAYRR